MTILFVSVLAANADPTYRAIAGYLARRTDLPVTIAERLPWPERERMIEGDQAAIGAICGATYVRLADQPMAPVQLLAAPIMQAARYHDQPVYFSDILVPAASQARAFADLRGARLAYNEPQSYSGYQIVRAHLAALGESGSFFGRIVAAGSHQAALRMVAAGAADVAAIDSTMLERELQHHPELLAQVRAIAALGPSPTPPLVAARHLPAAITSALRAALLAMHSDAEGHMILRAGLLARFVAVEDAAYDAIRAQLRRASTIDLAHGYSQDV